MSDNKMPPASAAVVLTLRGQHTETPRLPGRLAATRAVPVDNSAPDGSAEFLPAGYLIPRQTIELRAALPSRGSANTATPEPIVSLTVAPDEVVVLELADGGLLFTHGERLRDRPLSDLAPDLDASSTTRGVIADLAGAQISRVFTLAFGPLPPNDPVVEALGSQIEDSLIDAGARLVARAGVRGLVWAIESRLRGRVGLRRWHPDVGLRDWPFVDDDLVRQFPAADASQRLLVFIHDLASDTRASFGALQNTHTLAALERQFPGGLYGFEHVTLSRSPIDNALDLAKLLPVGAHVSFVTLGRGGLVADLLCMGEADPSVGRTRLPADDQPVFNELLAVLSQKRLVPERYLRVACPAQGTRLLGESLDAFLSGLLSLIGLAATGNPVAETSYAAFKRLVLEMVRHRAEAEVLPGLAPLMPDSPLTRLLGEAPARGGLQMAMLAGAVRGGGLMQRAGLWLAGRVLAGGTLHHDLLVDTPAMLAGLAARADAKVRLEFGAEVTHFRYFSSRAHQRALCDWLCEAPPLRDMAFEPLAAVRAQLERSDSGPAPVAETSSPASRGQAPSRSKPADTRQPSHEGPRSTRRRTLTVSVRADDLRFLADPLMIGHYEQDPIAGPQAIVDRELLDHALSQRHSLGLYPGPIGTASAILPSPGEQRATSAPVRGAVIIGLGRFDPRRTDRGGRRRGDAAAAAGARHARAGGARAAPEHTADRHQLVVEPVGRLVGGGAGAWRAGGQCALPRDDRAGPAHRAAADRRAVPRHRHLRRLRAQRTRAAPDAERPGHIARHRAHLRGAARTGRRRPPAAARQQRSGRQLLAAPADHRRQPARRRRRGGPIVIRHVVCHPPRRGRHPAALPACRPARPGRGRGAAAPARPGRATRSATDRPPALEPGLRPRPVPAHGAARVQGHRAALRAAGAGGGHAHRQPALGADAGR